MLADEVEYELENKEEEDEEYEEKLESLLVEEGVDDDIDVERGADIEDGKKSEYKVGWRDGAEKEDDDMD